MDNRDITERSILESERDELRYKVMQLETALQDSFVWFRLLQYLPESVFGDMLSVLDYGEKKHPGEEWKTIVPLIHANHARDHIEIYCRKLILNVPLMDHETGISEAAHLAVRALFLLALEKEK